MGDSSTFHEPLRRRSAFYRGYDGVAEASKGYDEVFAYVIDWVDALDTGETIAASSWDVNGPTKISDASTTTTTTITLSGTGEAKNTIITSATRTLERTLRFREGPISSDSDEDYT